MVASLLSNTGNVSRISIKLDTEIDINKLTLWSPVTKYNDQFSTVNYIQQGIYVTRTVFQAPWSLINMANTISECVLMASKQFNVYLLLTY